LRTKFKEGVEEFSDGSTCNAKLVIFWEKCKFKDGFGRNFLLYKKNWPRAKADFTTPNISLVEV
jgi:hypothetical protein